MWAGDVVPGDVDDAFAGGCELLESVWEEVEVVGAAAGTFVDDLPSASAWLLWLSFEHRQYMYVPHHRSHSFAGVVHAHTTTAVGAIGPVGTRERGTHEARGKRIGGERAGAAFNIAAVEGGLTGQ